MGREIESRQEQESGVLKDRQAFLRQPGAFFNMQGSTQANLEKLGRFQ
jgi:hypothetical protein